MLQRWVLAMTVGELVGFVPPAVVGASLAAIGAPDLAMVVGLTAAGLAEGAAIGVAQASVLSHTDARVDRADWIRATVVAAGFAWFVGMGGAALLGVSASPWVVALLVPAWLAALGSMGFLQWRVLRRTLRDCARWVPVNAGAWLLGVAIPVVALSAIPNAWPRPAHVVVGVVSAVAMGATVGAITGREMERLLN